jgi:hypothetical protein
LRKYPELNDQFSYLFLSFPGISAPLAKETSPFSDAFYQGGWGGYREFYAQFAYVYYLLDFPFDTGKYYDKNYIKSELEKLGY